MVQQPGLRGEQRGKVTGDFQEGGPEAKPHLGLTLLKNGKAQGR